MRKLTRTRCIAVMCVISVNTFALLPSLSFAQPASGEPSTEQTAPKDQKKRLDLADTVIGTYFGDVISDSQGSSRTGVTLYVTKVDKATVRVASDYARLPTVEVQLAVYSNQVQATKGAAVFVLNRNKSPQSLDFNPDGSVSFAGVRQE
jgi:hypothetical protein